MVKAENFIRMPLAELVTPRGGRLCIADHWWAVTDAEEVLFYRSHGSPQCNPVESLTERLACRGPIKTRPVFVPLAFVPHRCDSQC